MGGGGIMGGAMGGAMGGEGLWEGERLWVELWEGGAMQKRRMLTNPT